MIRTFIALEINPDTRDALRRDLIVLKKAAPRVKWVEPDNLHLTLKFLGDVKENDLEELFDTLDDALSGVAPFVVEMAGLGAFPHWRSPRVVWAGCGDGVEELADLAGLVDKACGELGYDRERRPFQPHLTLGRVKLPADAFALPSVVEALGYPDYGFVDVDAVSVYMSELRRTGPVYSPMHRIVL